MESSNNNNILWLGLGGIAVIYFGIIKPIEDKLGLSPTATDKATTDLQNQVANNAVASMNSVCTITPSTQSDASWVSIADTLYQQLDGIHFFNDSDIMQTIVSNVANQCDMLKLLSVFGNRTQHVMDIPVNSGSLPMFVTSILSDDSIVELNGYLSNVGVTFKF